MDSTSCRTEPESIAELLQWIAEFPQHAHRWRPAEEEMQRMTEAAQFLCRGVTGTDLELSVRPEPWTEEERRRLIVTIMDDPELREALREVLR